MRVELILEAIDRASGPIGRVQDAVDKIGKAKPPPAMPPAPPPPPPPGLPARGPDGRFLGAPDGMVASHQRSAAAIGSAYTGMFAAIGTGMSFAALLRPAIEFEAAVKRLGAISEASADDMKKLSGAAIDLGAKTSFSAQQTVEAMTALAASGMKTAQVMASIEGVLSLSEADGKRASLERYAEIVSETLAQFRLQAEASGRVVDVLAKGSLESSAAIGDMAQALKYVGPIAGTTGTSIEKTVAMISQLANAGIKGSNAGTALRMLFTRLADPPKKAAEAMEQIGVATKDAAGNLRPIIEILGDIERATAGMASGDRLGLLKAIAGQEALSGLSALLEGIASGKLSELANKMDQAQGSAAKLGAAFSDSTKGKIEEMMGALESLAIVAGTLLLPTIANVATQIASVAQQIMKWVQANPELATTLGQVALAAGALFIAGTVLGVLFKVLAYGAMALLSPLRAIGPALIWLGTAFRVLFGAARIGISFLGGFFSSISAGIAAVGGWGAVLQAVGMRIAGLQLRFALLAGMIASRFPALASIGGMLAAPFAMAGRALLGLGAAMMATPIGWFVAGIAAVAAAAYLIYANWGAIGPWLAQLWNRIVAGVQAGVASFIAAVSGIGAGLAGALTTGWDAVTGWFAGLSWPALPPFAAMIGDVFGPVLAALRTGWNDIVGWFGSFVWPALPPLTFDVLGMMRAAFEPALAWITDWGGRLFSVFDQVFGRVGTFVDGAVGRIGAAFGTIGGALSAASDFVFGPSQSSVKATAEQAAAARAAMDAIPPAAQQAVSATTAIFAAANFHSHGVAMMATLAAGIRAGAAEAVAAAQGTVQKIRNLLPHSPAKEGPLSDLDRVQFGQTLAGAIRMGAPQAVAAAAALAAGLAGTIQPGVALPSMAAAGGAAALATPSLAQPAQGSPAAAGGGVSAGGPITVNLTLAPSFQGGGATDFITQLRQALPGVAHELAETLRAELGRRERTTH